jgi:hypothetical protein
MVTVQSPVVAAGPCACQMAKSTAGWSMSPSGAWRLLCDTAGSVEKFPHHTRDKSFFIARKIVEKTYGT